MNENNRTGEETRAITYRPKLSFYHANSKGTGSVLALELIPARREADGCIMASFASQMTVGNRNSATPTYPRFDYENKITIKLGFNDLCKMLQVFRGECETIEEGKGLFHSTGKFTTRISMRHVIEPVNGYQIEICRATKGVESSQQRIYFMLFTHEALGLTLAIENSMGLITFGVPAGAERSASGTGDRANYGAGDRTNYGAGDRTNYGAERAAYGAGDRTNYGAERAGERRGAREGADVHAA